VSVYAAAVRVKYFETRNMTHEPSSAHGKVALVQIGWSILSGQWHERLSADGAVEGVARSLTSNDAAFARSYGGRFTVATSTQGSAAGWELSARSRPTVQVVRGSSGYSLVS
jgi:hypothetical protein